MVDLMLAVAVAVKVTSGVSVKYKIMQLFNQQSCTSVVCLKPKMKMNPMTSNMQILLEMYHSLLYTWM